MRIASNRCSPGGAPVWVMATPISRPCWYMTGPCKQITSRVKGQRSKTWIEIMGSRQTSDLKSVLTLMSRKYHRTDWLKRLKVGGLNEAAARKVIPFWIHFKFRPAVHRRQISNDWHAGEKRLKSICHFFLPSRVHSEWKNRSKYWPPPKFFFCC